MNPIDALRDLITNKAYGLGEVIDAHTEQWLQALHAYCEEEEAVRRKPYTQEEEV